MIDRFLGHMIFPPKVRAAGFAAIAATLVFPHAGLAFDDATRDLARNLLALESLNALGDDLTEVLTVDVGFPAEYIEDWHAAVDVAFTPQLLESDFLNALEAQLSDDARTAALALDASVLGQDTRRLNENAFGNEPGAEALAKVRARIEGASAQENALFVDLFELQRGPRRANAAMDLYFRAMKVAAEPLIGAEAADRWILSAGDLRSGYVEEYFLTAVMMYDQLPANQRQELVNKLKTPEMIAYADQSSTAFEDALNAAADRLEVAYDKQLRERE